MSDVAEIESLQLQIEELRAQLNTLRIGEAVSVPSREMNDVWLVTGFQEWRLMRKRKLCKNFFSKIENLATVSGWTN